MTIQRLAVPMKYVSVSQTENSLYSHKGLLALDMNGMDSQQDYGRAPCYVKVLAVLDKASTTMNNTVLFGSCDESGNQAKVLFNDGTKAVVTVAMTHMNSIKNIKVGKIYAPLEECYLEGTTGNATGNNIHIEVGLGWQTKKVKRSDGNWALQDLVSLKRCFCLLKGFHQISNLGLKEYENEWPWVDSLTVEEEIPNGEYGIDVSAWDEEKIDFKKAKEQGVKFVIVRAGFGADKGGQHDTYWPKNISECKENGIPIGAYIYSYAENVLEATNEAKHIIRLADEVGGPSQFPYGLWFDQENELQTKLSKETNTEMAIAFSNEVKKAGYRAGFYSYRSWLDTHVHIDKIDKELLLWVASYGTNNGSYHQDPKLPKNTAIHQYTSKNIDRQFSTRKELDQNICTYDFSSFEIPIEPEKEDEVLLTRLIELIKVLIELLTKIFK